MLFNFYNFRIRLLSAGLVTMLAFPISAHKFLELQPGPGDALFAALTNLRLGYAATQMLHDWVVGGAESTNEAASPGITLSIDVSALPSAVVIDESPATPDAFESAAYQFMLHDIPDSVLSPQIRQEIAEYMGAEGDDDDDNVDMTMELDELDAAAEDTPSDEEVEAELPVLQAIMRNDADALFNMLRTGANVDEMHQATGLSAVDYAFLNGHHGMLEILVGFGARLSPENRVEIKRIITDLFMAQFFSTFEPAMGIPALEEGAHPLEVINYYTLVLSPDGQAGFRSAFGANEVAYAKFISLVLQLKGIWAERSVLHRSGLAHILIERFNDVAGELNELLRSLPSPESTSTTISTATASATSTERGTVAKLTREDLEVLIAQTPALAYEGFSSGQRIPAKFFVGTTRPKGNVGHMWLNAKQNMVITIDLDRHGGSQIKVFTMHNGSVQRMSATFELNDDGKTYYLKYNHK